MDKNLWNQPSFDLLNAKRRLDMLKTIKRSLTGGEEEAFLLSAVEKDLEALRRQLRAHNSSENVIWIE